MTASSISFKSVGKSATTVRSEAQAARQTVPIGIKTPLRRGAAQLFETNSDLFEQLRDNLRNLILTNHGERLCLFDFGANLNELSLERTSRQDHDSEVAARIAAAVEKWMPYVALDELTPLDDPTDPLGRSRTSTIPIRRYLLTYSVPTLNSPKQTLEIILGIA